MHEFEILVALLFAAVLLAALARRIGAPYPALLAPGGAVLAFIPGMPVFTIDPNLALALFIAPVLLDAAYDASLRDLRDNWGPVAGLVVVSVGLTTLAVAGVARAMVPGLEWAPAIALGAIVSPPDAAAATAVLRPLKPPQRLMTILEGESLLNDASALLIYRLAIGAVIAGGFSFRAVAPTFGLAVAGSLLAGPALGWVSLRATGRVQDMATTIILQFLMTFGVWILAERIGLSPVLTMVCYAVTVARWAPARIPARLRLPSYAVWETVVFVLNVLAFVFIGLQVRPIVGGLEPATRIRYFWVAGAVLGTVILVRLVWVMSYNTALRWRIRRVGWHPPRPTLKPTVGSGLIVAWAGMRGIVSLAAALALPAIDGQAFPHRDLIVLTAFAVVVGTLVIQGLTLRPLLNALELHDEDPVGHEVDAARDLALEAALETFQHDQSAAAAAVREELAAHLKRASADSADGDGPQTAHEHIHRRAIAAARQTILDLRSRDEIGDDAFHRLEEEFDWLEMGTLAGAEPGTTEE